MALGLEEGVMKRHLQEPVEPHGGTVLGVCRRLLCEIDWGQITEGLNCHSFRGVWIL